LKINRTKIEKHVFEKTSYHKWKISSKILNTLKIGELKKHKSESLKAKTERRKKQIKRAEKKKIVNRGTIWKTIKIKATIQGERIW
jgi:hypothetical protein